MIHFHAVARVDDCSRDAGECIDHRKDRQSPLSLGNPDSFLGQRAGDPVLAEDFLDFLSFGAEFGLHRLLDDAGERVPPRIPLEDQGFDDPANVAKGIVDVGRVLAGELDDFHRVPHDVVLANRLIPKRLDAQRTAADFGIPDKESRRKRLAVDLGPARGVDEETEHVLFSTVQAGPAVEALWRRLKIRGEFLHHGQHIAVIQSGVAGRMDRAELLALGQQLQRLLASRQGFREDVGGSVGGKADSRFPWQRPPNGRVG